MRPWLSPSWNTKNTTQKMLVTVIEMPKDIHCYLTLSTKFDNKLVMIQTNKDYLDYIGLNIINKTIKSSLRETYWVFIPNIKTSFIPYRIFSICLHMLLCALKLNAHLHKFRCASKCVYTKALTQVCRPIWS